MNQSERPSEPLSAPAENPFAALDTTDDRGRTPRAVSADRRVAFSLRSLFLFFTVCAVLAEFIALVVVAANEDKLSTDLLLDSDLGLAVATVMLLPAAGIVGALLYGRKTGIALSVVLALVAGPLVGVSLFLPTKLAVIRNLVAFGAALLLIGFGLIYCRPPSYDE